MALVEKALVKVGGEDLPKPSALKKMINRQRRKLPPFEPRDLAFQVTDTCTRIRGTMNVYCIVAERIDGCKEGN